MSQFDLFGGHTVPIVDMRQPPTVQQERDRVLERIQAKAGEQFMDAAILCIERYLQHVPEASGEQLVDACKERGIKPATDDRAFGPVLMKLSREGVIEKAGYTVRQKGHGTSGGVLWRRKR
jgi:hypothetical protein